MSRDQADAADAPADGDIALRVATGVARVARAGAYVTGGTLVAANGAPAVATESHDSRFAGWAVQDPHADAPPPVVTYPDLSENDVRVPAHLPIHADGAASPANPAAFVPQGPPMDYDPITTQLPVVHAESPATDLADDSGSRNSAPAEQIRDHSSAPASSIAQPAVVPETRHDGDIGPIGGNGDDDNHTPHPAGGDDHRNSWSSDADDHRNLLSGSDVRPPSVVGGDSGDALGTGSAGTDYSDPDDRGRGGPDGDHGRDGDNRPQWTAADHQQSWGPGGPGAGGALPAAVEPGADVALPVSSPPDDGEPGDQQHGPDAAQHGGVGVYFSSSTAADVHAGFEDAWVQTGTQAEFGAGAVGSELDAYRASLVAASPAGGGSPEPGNPFALTAAKHVVPPMQFPVAPSPMASTPMQTVVQPEAAAHPIADVLSTHGGVSPLTVVPAAVPALLGLDHPETPHGNPPPHHGATATPPVVPAPPVKPPFPIDLGRLPGLGDTGAPHGVTTPPVPLTTVPLPSTAAPVPTTVPLPSASATPPEVPSSDAPVISDVPLPSGAQAVPSVTSDAPVPTVTVPPQPTTHPPLTTAVPHAVVPTTVAPVPSAKPIAADIGPDRIATDSTQFSAPADGVQFHVTDGVQFHSTAWMLGNGDWSGHAGLAVEPAYSVPPDPQHHFVPDLHMTL